MSTSETDRSLDDAIEAVCQRGCRYVRQAIAAMQRGEVPAELSGVPADLRGRALDELQAVMAVYDRECSAEPGAGSETPGRASPAEERDRPVRRGGEVA